MGAGLWWSIVLDYGFWSPLKPSKAQSNYGQHFKGGSPGEQQWWSRTTPVVIVSAKGTQVAVLARGDGSTNEGPWPRWAVPAIAAREGGGVVGHWEEVRVVLRHNPSHLQLNQIANNPSGLYCDNLHGFWHDFRWLDLHLTAIECFIGQRLIWKRILRSNSIGTWFVLGPIQGVHKEEQKHRSISKNYFFLYFVSCF